MMAFSIRGLLCLKAAPINGDAVFAPANMHSDTMTKPERDDEKLLNYTSVLDWIFSTKKLCPQQIIPDLSFF